MTRIRKRTEVKVSKSAWEMFAVMEDDKLVGLVAKNPNRHEVIDILDDLRALLAKDPPDVIPPEDA